MKNGETYCIITARYLFSTSTLIKNGEIMLKLHCGNCLQFKILQLERKRQRWLLNCISRIFGLLFFLLI